MALAAVAALLAYRRRRLSTVLTSLGLMIVSATIVQPFRGCHRSSWRLSESLQRVTKNREHKLVEAQELAHLGSWEYERATGWCRWSEEQYRLLGFSPPSVSPTFENFLRGELPDGSVRWLHGRGAVSEWNGSVAKRMHGTSQDVTELRLADDARRASDVRYRKLVETAQEGIWS